MLDKLDPRLRAVLDLTVPRAREAAGHHEYDGVVQDLSPTGVQAGLAALTRSATAVSPDGLPASSRDQAHLSAAMATVRTWFGELELHRSNPQWHLDNLELTNYDRDYAPADERASARRRHLAAWPDAIDAAVSALDRVPAAVADAVLPSARALAEGPAEDDRSAGKAVARLIAHLEAARDSGAPMDLDKDRSGGSSPLRGVSTSIWTDS